MVGESNNAARAKAYLIAVLQHPPGDLLAIDEGAMRRTQIRKGDIILAVNFNKGVTPRDHIAVENDVAFRQVTANDGSGRIEMDLGSAHRTGQADQVAADIIRSAVLRNHWHL